MQGSYKPTGSLVIDPHVKYEGPKSYCATFGGSPTWGLGDKFYEFAERETDWKRIHVHRPATPYGLGPEVEEYARKDDPSLTFLRIPTYGQTFNEDPVLGEYKAFWIIWSAGVKVLLVGGTSGTCDWRQSEEGVLPGDFAIPATYFPTNNMPYGLPGTSLEFCLGRQVAIMDDPFCSSFVDVLCEEAIRTGIFRKVHKPPGSSSVESDKVIETEICLNRWVGGNGFESRGECKRLQVLGQQMGMPTITGDCVSPILARVCGMHLVYYHIPVNWGTGLVKEDPTKTLNKYYLEVLPEKAASLEINVLNESLKRRDAATSCSCISLLKNRPEAYQRAFTQKNN